MTRTRQQGSVGTRCSYVLMSAVAVLGTVLMLGVATASASKGVVGTIGEGGTGAGEFDFPGGVAVNQSSGDVYVADVFSGSGGNRIEQFTADGAFIRAWGWGVTTGANTFEVCASSCRPGSAGPGEGQLSLEFDGSVGDPQIAIDQADGAVYVADTLNDRVQKFSATGAFLGSFGSTGTGDGEFLRPQGIAVDPVTRDVYVGDTTSADGAVASNRVQRFSSAGGFQSQIGTTGGGVGEGDFLGPARLAVDSVGRLYVFDRDNARVQRFASDGTFDRIFAAGVLSAPSDLAVDPANDHVYISGTNADLSVEGIFEFDGDGQSVDVHAPHPGFSWALVGGMAVRSSTDRIYAATQAIQSVAILEDAFPPAVTIDPVSTIGPHGATVTGEVDPQGPPDTTFRFEYSTDGVTWTPVRADVSVGSGDASVEVSQAVTGLEANTEYRIRLIATKAFNVGTATSTEVTFITQTAPPAVRPVTAGSRTDVAAWLGGEVNPRKLETSAYIEFTGGADSTYSLSSRVPADDVNIGDGNEFVPISQLATGLQPRTTYRFRVVATNAAGTTEGPERTFTTRAALPEPPPGRAYEMVSPLDKNGGEVDRDLPGFNSTSGAAASGDSVTYLSRGQFGDMDSGATGQYLSVRRDDGWTTRATNPPVAPQPGIDAVVGRIPFMSEDLSSAIVSTNASLTPGAAADLGGTMGLYLRDNTGSVPSYQLLSDPVDPLPPQVLPPISRADRFSFIGASSDMHHIVFDSLGRRLTPDGLALETGTGVYEWAQGQVRFVSMLPSGMPAENGHAGGHANEYQFNAGGHPVSDDGQRIYFVDGTAHGDADLYVRENGTTTKAVSVSERSGDDSSVVRQAAFQAAKADDGSLALFRSRDKLTDDATACDALCFGGRADDLYLWDATAPAGARLTDLTTADPQGGGVLAVVGAAEDLSRVYFVATGDLGEGATRGLPNLYAWSPAEGIRRLATLDPQDTRVWGEERAMGANQFRDVRVSADGTRLVFASHARLTPDGTGAAAQVYLYDYARDRLTCVSCPSEGAAGGPAWLFFGPDATSESYSPMRLPRNLVIDSDGVHVFFETANALDPADTNGKADVYQWFDSELSLISTGRSSDGAKFVDASADGRDVFFTTRERLAGADVDNQVDIYDARIDGGFPEPSAPPPCITDTCQSPSPSRPPLSSPSSDRGAGDPPIHERAAFRVRGLRAGQRRALASGRWAVLVVRVNKPGRVTVRGTARVRGKERVVTRASRRARGAGPVKLSLRLSKAARLQLAARGRIRVSLRVRFADAEETKALSAVLRQSVSRKGR